MGFRSATAGGATQRRLALLVRAGELFHRSLDLEETLRNVARTAVESFSDLCLVDLLDEGAGGLYVSVGAHRDPSAEPSLKAAVSPLLQHETRGMHPARQVALTGQSFFVPVFDEAALTAHASSDAHEAFMRRMQYRSKIVVPIAAFDQIFGALTFVRVGPNTEPFDADDRDAAQELGRRAGLAVANARQYEREQATQRRLTLLVRAGELFHRSLDLEQTLTNVARTAVESFADLCLLDLIDDSTGRLYVSVGAHRDPEVERSLAAMVTQILQSETRGVHPARHVAQSGNAFFVPVFTEQVLLEHASSDAHEAFMRMMDYGSKIVVPVAAHETIFGALTFVRTKRSPRFEQDDMAAAQELGRRAGLAVANAKQFSREQHVAETLQRAFLSDDLPAGDAFRFGAVYQAAQRESALGGDWYEAFPAGDQVVMTIGDVTGKGVDAARLMVEIRQWIKLAAVVTMDPAGILSLLNRALLLDRDELATAFVAVMDKAATTVRFASAGHPNPVLKSRSGTPRILDGAHGLPLGVGLESRYETRTVELGDAALLLLYTDGLTEIERDPVRGEAALLELLADDAILYAANPARYILRLTHGRESGDDLAALSVSFGHTAARWSFDVADAAAAYAIKHDFVQALGTLCGGGADTTACELIFSELAGNALRYAPGRLSLGLSADDEGCWLHVMDEGPGFEPAVSLPADLWSESGRGLFLVRALARRLTIRRLPVYGTYVRALLPVEGGA